MFTSFEDDSIGCQCFQDIQVNEGTIPNNAVAPGSSRKSPRKNDFSVGQNILSALKNLQEKLQQLEMDRKKLESDRTELTSNLVSWKKAANTGVQTDCSHSSSFPAPVHCTKNKSTNPTIYIQKSVPSRMRDVVSVERSYASPISSRQELRCCDDWEPQSPNKSQNTNSFSACPRLNEFDDWSHDTLGTVGNAFSPLRNVELTKSAESELNCASARCQLLEKQLDSMRTKVCMAEQERAHALENQVKMAKENGKMCHQKRKERVKITRLNNLESQNQELAVKNNEYHKKMEALEEELKHEKHQRQLILDRAIQLEAEATAKQILENSNNLRKCASPKRAKPSVDRRYEKPVRLRNTKIAKPSKPRCSSPHYRLNLADLPFIAGTSTSPSHCFSGRIQNLFYDLKLHNSRICGKESGPSSFTKAKRAAEKCKKNPEIERWEELLNSENLEQNAEDLGVMIESLQDDFCKLTDEHRVVRKQLEMTPDEDKCSYLNDQLIAITSQMEEKASMITTLKSLQCQQQEMLERKHDIECQKQQDERRKAVDGKKVASRGGNKKHTFKKPGLIAKQRQELLRKVNTFQQGLKKDDICWE